MDPFDLLTQYLAHRDEMTLPPPAEAPPAAEASPAEQLEDPSEQRRIA